MDFCFSDHEEMADFPPPLPVQKPVGGPPPPAKPARKVRPYKPTTAVQQSLKQWAIRIKCGF